MGLAVAGQDADREDRAGLGVEQPDLVVLTGAQGPEVVGGDGHPPVAVEVTGTARYTKAAFPTEAVFGPVTGPVLRLITCGGDFGRASGHYLDNVVVTARPAGGP